MNALAAVVCELADPANASALASACLLGLALAAVAMLGGAYWVVRALLEGRI